MGADGVEDGDAGGVKIGEWGVKLLVTGDVDGTGVGIRTGDGVCNRA